MNFYHAYYTRQHYDKDTATWRDTCYDSQSIIVIAEDYNEALLKIYKCLPEVETGAYRAVLGEIVECIGLDGRHGFESYGIYPITNEKTSHFNRFKC